jgi:GAF domain-containing protein
VVELPPRTPLPAEASARFDRFARIVAERLQAPIGLVSLVDVNGQVFPGAFGLAEPWNEERATPLSHSFCQHVVTSGQPLVVSNSHDDPLVADNLAVMDLGVVAYAGVPVQAGAAGVVGSLCALDHRPRQWSEDDLAALTALAALCSEELEDEVQERP